MPLNSESRFRLILFCVLPLCILIWLGAMYSVSGYFHEPDKLKQFIFCTIIVFLFQFYIGDPIKFFCEALIMTSLDKHPFMQKFRHGIPKAKVDNDMRFYKMRIEWNKARLNYNWRHRDENLNVFYRNTFRDILFYLRYYILLILLIIALSEPLEYYQSDGLTRALSDGRLRYKTHDNIDSIDDIWVYIEKVIIDAFQRGENADNTVIREPGWMHYRMGKELGVTRIVQVRLAEKPYGLCPRNYTQRHFMPGWKLPYKRLPYVKEYWRMYDPWVAKRSLHNYLFFMPRTRQGNLDIYPVERAYVAEFARNWQNSLTILNFLKEHSWIDNMTAAIFIDFVVYSVDANIFGLVDIAIEFTPYGYPVFHTRVDDVKLLLNWDATANWYWLILVLYIMQLAQFLKRIIVKVWFSGITVLFNVWNLMDVIIVFLTILVLSLYAWRESMAIQLVQGFAMESKLKYIGFRSLTSLTFVAEVCLGLLVCIATVRLWKLLLFARVFRLFIRTLRAGAVDVFWALTNIMIFLIGLTISSYMINGAANTVSRTPITFVHILSFSLGYSERVNPMEKEYEGGLATGLIIYACVMFSVTLVLANMLVTLVSMHFSESIQYDRTLADVRISFWEFLQVEYDFIWRHVVNLRRKIRRKFQGRVREKITRLFHGVENRLGAPTKKKAEEEAAKKSETHENRLRRTRIVTDILMCQINILNRQLEALNKEENEKKSKQAEEKE